VRTSTLLAAALAALISVAVSGVAQAQHHGQGPSTFVPKEQQTTEHHRKGEVNDFGSQTRVPERPFPWRALMLGALLMLVASPVAYGVYRSTAKDLSAMKTVGRNEGINGDEKLEPRARKAVGAAKADAAESSDASSRDRVLEVVQSVDQWVPVDWVAKSAGISVADATDELNGLAQDGQLEHANDRSGNPIFKAVAG
jgi:hypothetical protein